MKILSTITIGLLVCGHVFAVDFHSIIVENNKAQKNLHTQIKDTVIETQIAAQKARKGEEPTYIADHSENTQVVSKTRPEIFKAAKEYKTVKPNLNTANERVAQEFKEIE